MFMCIIERRGKTSEVLMLWNIIPVKNRSSPSQHKICVMYVLCSTVCGAIQMFFKGFRVQHDWSYCTITKLLTFSTTLVPVVFRLAVMLVFKMIYSMYGCTVEPLQTNKAIFVCFYCAVQMSSFLGLTVLCIGCAVVAVLPETVAHVYLFFFLNDVWFLGRFNNAGSPHAFIIADSIWWEVAVQPFRANGSSTGTPYRGCIIITATSSSLNQSFSPPGFINPCL